MTKTKSVAVARRAAGLCTSLLLAAIVAACGGGETADLGARQQPLSVSTTSELLAAPASGGLSGAIYTTTTPCGAVNVNQFDTKPDVFLNGGPKGGGSGLPDGYYWVKVSDPSGATLLGTTPTSNVKVTNGAFDVCYQLVNILVKASDGQPGYDTTPNGGGVYKVWVSLAPGAGLPFDDTSFGNGNSKTDNFKVLADACVPGDPACTPDPLGTLTAQKYYDANANGGYDTGEVLIEGWKVSITAPDATQATVLTTYSELAKPGSYVLDELMPVELNWYATDPGPKTGVVVDQQETTVRFGNVCVGVGGGKTLGFWSNRNGQAMVGSDDLTMLRDPLNLRKADGAAFDPTTNSQFRSWILSATATNMAYMLSAQMAAAQLNVFNGLVAPSSLIYVGTGFSFPGLLPTGFAKISDVIAAANTSLGSNGSTGSGSPARAYQEWLKNALDAANNDRNFVQATPCAFTFN